MYIPCALTLSLSLPSSLRLVLSLSNSYGEIGSFYIVFLDMYVRKFILSNKYRRCDMRSKTIITNQIDPKMSLTQNSPTIFLKGHFIKHTYFGSSGTKHPFELHAHTHTPEIVPWEWWICVWNLSDWYCLCRNEHKSQPVDFGRLFWWPTLHRDIYIGYIPLIWSATSKHHNAF